MLFKVTPTRGLGWITLFVCGVLWGSFFILIKKALEGLTPVEVASLRPILVAICLSPLLYGALRSITRRNFPSILVMAVFGNGVPLLFYPIAQSHISSAMAGIINSLTPLFALFVGWMFFSLRTNIWMWSGLILGFAGVVALFLGSVSGANSSGVSGELLYIGVAVLCALNNGASSNYLNRYLRGFPSPYIGCLMFTFCAVPGAIWLTWNGTFTRIAEGEINHVPLMWLGVLALCTSCAAIMYNWLITRYSAVFATSSSYLLPAVAIFWGLLDGETMGWRELVGVALILTGIYLTNRRTVRPVAPPPIASSTNN